jgi:HEPN domain-containing protein
MQAVIYNQWDFYPLNLTPEQVSNPLSVISTFFDNDSLPGHLETLRNWCFAVLKPGYFRNEKGSPSGLLYFHKLTISLIEAVYLVKDLSEKPVVSATASQLAFEQQEWSSYPSLLSKEQQLNPYLVIDDFFSQYSLPQYREQLYDWLEFGLSIKAGSEFIDAADLINIQENLQKLFGAAWLILQRSAAKPSLKNADNKSKLITTVLEKSTTPKTATNLRPLYELNNNMADMQAALIKKVVTVITHKVDSVQAVLYLGAAPSGKLYLLVLMANDEKRQAQEIAGMIEDSCKELATIIALVHHASALYTALKRGNVFFNNALVRQAVYLSGDLLLPVVMPFSSVRSTESLFKWQHWIRQANDFFNGAEYHLLNGADNAALFCLHQSVECILVALVRGILGYDINNHNLSRLLAITEMFTNDLTAVFNLADAQSLPLFNELKQAYVNVRYKDGYEANKDDVVALMRVVRLLLTRGEQIYEKHVLTNIL